MRRALLPLLLVACLLAPLVPTAAASAEPAVVSWRYTIGVPEPASGAVHVELAIDGAQGIVTTYTFHTEAAGARNVTGGPATPLRAVPGGVELTVDGPESFSYEVVVEDEGFRPGQRLEHVGDDFALFKAESLQLEFGYRFFGGKTWVNETRVALAPPEGWSARGPWALDAEGAYALPRGEVMPSGFVVFGAFRDEQVFDAAGKRFRYVRLGEPGAFEPDMAAYLANATPRYEATYGPVVGAEVLVVSAPDPMFRGGLGGVDSLYLHESVDLPTLAHEYAHVFQRFSSQEAPPSTIWLTEGDADWASARSLFETGYWSARQVDAFLDDARRDAENASLADARLVDATYGSPLERFAYHKGAVVLHALDARLLDATGGASDIGELLRRLNEAHADAPVTNADVRALAEEIAGEDLGAFFDAYVEGPHWPEPRAFAPARQLVVESLRVEPDRAPANATVNVTARLANAGNAPLAQRVDVQLDDDLIGWQMVELAPGAAANVTFSLVAPERPGDHDVRVHDANETLRTLAPPRIVVDRIMLPAPTAGEPATFELALRNIGEIEGTATAEIVIDGETRAATEALAVPAGASRELTLDVTFPRAGSVDVRLRVTGDGPGLDRVETLTVRAAFLSPAAPSAPAASPSPDAPPAGAAPAAAATDRDAPALPFVLALAALALVARMQRRRRG